MFGAFGGALGGIAKGVTPRGNGGSSGGLSSRVQQIAGLTPPSPTEQSPALPAPLARAAYAQFQGMPPQEPTPHGLSGTLMQYLNQGRGGLPQPSAMYAPYPSAGSPMPMGGAVTGARVPGQEQPIGMAGQPQPMMGGSSYGPSAQPNTLAEYFASRRRML